MSIARQASLFRNGRNQAVRIPREFEFEGDAVTIRKEGDALIIEPAKRKLSFQEWLARAQPIEDEMGDIPDYPPEAVDL